MEAVAGAVLGPRPGKAVCSFWQGKVEILLWIVAPLFGSLPALIAAAVSLSDVDSVRDSADSSVNDSDSSFSSTGDEDVDVTRSEVRGSAGFVIGFAALALLLSLLWIIIRFCNIGLVNLKVKIFLIIAIIIGVILCLGHIAGGVVSAFYAEGLSEVGGLVRNGLAASAAFCFLAAILYGLVVVWVAIYMVKEWNDKVVKYTLKEAVTG